MKGYMEQKKSEKIMYSMNTAYDHSGKRELGAMHSNRWTAHKLNSTLMKYFSSKLLFVLREHPN